MPIQTNPITPEETTTKLSTISLPSRWIAYTLFHAPLMRLNVSNVSLLFFGAEATKTYEVISLSLRSAPPNEYHLHVETTAPAPNDIIVINKSNQRHFQFNLLTLHPLLHFLPHAPSWAGTEPLYQSRILTLPQTHLFLQPTISAFPPSIQSSWAYPLSLEFQIRWPSATQHPLDLEITINANSIAPLPAYANDNIARTIYLQLSATYPDNLPDTPPEIPIIRNHLNLDVLLPLLPPCWTLVDVNYPDFDANADLLCYTTLPIPPALPPYAPSSLLAQFHHALLPNTTALNSAVDCKQPQHLYIDDLFANTPPNSPLCVLQKLEKLYTEHVYNSMSC